MHYSQRMGRLSVAATLLLAGCGQPTTKPAAQPAGASTPGIDPRDFSWLETRKDLPFPVKEFLAQRKPSADEEHRLALYRQGLDLISADLGSPQSADLQRKITEASDLTKLMAGAFSDAQIEQIITDTRPAVVLLDQAQATPTSTPRRMVFAYTLRSDALFPEVQAARQVAKLAAIEFFHARKTNQLEPAHHAFERSLQMSRDLQPQGPMVCQLTSMAIDNFTLESVAKLLLDHPNLTAADCDRLLATLKRHQEQSLPRIVESIKADYLTIINTLAAIREQKLDAKTAFEELGSGMPKDLKASEIDFETEAAALGQLMAIALQDADIAFPLLPAKPRFTIELDRLTNSIQAGWEQNKKMPAATVLLAPSVETARDAQERFETSLHGLQCLIALRRYELTHGSLPATLEAATTEAGFKGIPQDRYDGKPLKYTLNSGAALVYSVGKDKRDDGGKSDWNFGQQAGDFLFPLPRLPPKAAIPSTAAPPAEPPSNAGESADTPKSPEPPNPKSPRKWTSTAGTTIEATLVSVGDNEVVLRRADGKELRVPLDKLSAADREWLKQQK